MSTYEDATISEAHRRALDARLEMLRRYPELGESKFAAALRSAFGESDCGKLQSEADHLFELAREAYESGDPDSGDFSLLAGDALGLYHKCLLREPLPPPDEFFGSEA
jgi:hypothetical protein